MACLLAARCCAGLPQKPGGVEKPDVTLKPERSGRGIRRPAPVSRTSTRVWASQHGTGRLCFALPRGQRLLGGIPGPGGACSRRPPRSAAVSAAWPRHDHREGADHRRRARIVTLAGSGLELGTGYVLCPGLVVERQGHGASPAAQQRQGMTRMPELVAFMHSMIGLAAVPSPSRSSPSPHAFGIVAKGNDPLRGNRLGCSWARRSAPSPSLRFGHRGSAKLSEASTKFRLFQGAPVAVQRPAQATWLAWPRPALVWHVHRSCDGLLRACWRWPS